MKILFFISSNCITGRIIIKPLLIFLLLFACCREIKAQAYPGTNLRGQIILSQTQTPFVSAKVEIWFFVPGQQWRLIASTFTDVYGFYYFRYIIPNNYTIWINGARSFPVQVVFIDYRYYAYQDIPRYFF